tara:strand:- start:35314 stop:35670 length:357 start_codon:yes stop_codon:yes gene_type:complete
MTASNNQGQSPAQQEFLNDVVNASTDLVVLRLLAIEPGMYGVKIREELMDLFEIRWGIATPYRVLGRLESEGLVVSETHPTEGPKKLYWNTQRGEQRLAELQEAYGPFSKAMTDLLID